LAKNVKQLVVGTHQISQALGKSLGQGCQVWLAHAAEQIAQQESRLAVTIEIGRREQGQQDFGRLMGGSGQRGRLRHGRWAGCRVWLGFRFGFDGTHAAASRVKASNCR
jgi:hypothetical protein